MKHLMLYCTLLIFEQIWNSHYHFPKIEGNYQSAIPIDVIPEEDLGLFEYDPKEIVTQNQLDFNHNDLRSLPQATYSQQYKSNTGN